MQYKIGDVVNGHVLIALPNGLTWVPLVSPTNAPVAALPVQVVSVADDNTTRFLNIGRSRTIVFKGEDPMKDKVTFTPQDKPKRRWRK